MSKAVLVLDAAALVLGAFILVTSARTHGMRATVHFVRLCCVVMVLFAAVQMRWSNLFDKIEGIEVLDDFMDVHNALALTFSFYVMSIIVLAIYDAWERRFSSTKAETSGPPVSTG